MEQYEKLYRRRIRKDREYLQKQFESVCKEFFPRWRGWKDWKVKSSYLFDALGLCDRERKTIFLKSDGFLCHDLKRLVHRFGYRERSWNGVGKTIGSGLTPKQSLQCFFIHEICHAVTHHGLPHGKNWRDRIVLASKRARELGRKNLAQHLYQEKDLKFLESDERREVELLRKARRQFRKEVNPIK